MKKRVQFSRINLMILLWIIMMIGSSPISYADWWERPTERPTQPAVERNLPTSAPEPTNPPEPTSTQPTTAQPSPTPRVGEPTLPPSNGGGNNDGGGSADDPCGPGKSYNGPYCGWSPRVGGEEGSANAFQVAPKVRGLSYTSSYDLGLSDIILLSGVLCLLLYIKSKFTDART